MTQAERDMKWLENAKIGTRLGVGFGLLIVLILAMAGLGIQQLATARAISDRLGGEDAELLMLAQQWLTTIESNRARGWVVFFTTDTRIVSRMADEMTETTDVQTRRIDRMNQLAQDGEARALMATILQQRDAYQALRRGLLAHRDAGEDVSGRVFEQLFPAATAYRVAVEGLVQRQVDTVHATKEAAQRAARVGVTAMVGGAGCAVLLGVALAWWLTRSVVGPVRQTRAVLEAIAVGDLRVSVGAGAGDELGAMMGALARMVESLRAVVSTVRAGSDSIATGSSQIATGNTDLSHRTEEQAANLQRTAASMQQLAETVEANAATARTVSELAGSASTVAVRGAVVVEQVVTHMAAIVEASRKVVDIIGVIDSIAFQTNILSLNAAVEAAQAGEKGRGFAVVAGEIGNLAQRSALAAKEIKALISTSVAKVEVGRQQVSVAGSTMSDIVQRVQHVSELIAGIDAATNEQMLGIGQVRDAVHHLDEVTQQNAALVEQSAAAADSLSQQAGMLVASVQAFKL